MRAIFDTEKEMYDFRDKLIKRFPSPRNLILGRFETDDGDKFYIEWSNVDTNIDHYKFSSEILGYDEKQCYKNYISEQK